MLKDFFRGLFHAKKIPYKSETSKVRHLVSFYCIGKGCDVGFGGDKIMKENCDGIDFEKPYAYTGQDKVDIACDLFKEKIPVADNTYDYVYSSHLIEDFPDTNAVLKDFIRILKSGGNLILVFPDQPKYALHCEQTGQPVNLLHVHADMGLHFMKSCISQLENIKVDYLFTSDCDIDYNVIIVCSATKL